MPDGWEAIADRRIAAWRTFDDDERARLADDGAVIASRKRWEGGKQVAATSPTR